MMPRCIFSCWVRRKSCTFCLLSATSCHLRAFWLRAFFSVSVIWAGDHVPWEDEEVWPSKNGFPLFVAIRVNITDQDQNLFQNHIESLELIPIRPRSSKTSHHELLTIIICSPFASLAPKSPRLRIPEHSATAACAHQRNAGAVQWLHVLLVCTWTWYIEVPKRTLGQATEKLVEIRSRTVC